jgi:hypothetical protein
VQVWGVRPFEWGNVLRTLDAIRGGNDSRPLFADPSPLVQAFERCFQGTVPAPCGRLKAGQGARSYRKGTCFQAWRDRPWRPMVAGVRGRSRGESVSGVRGKAISSSDGGGHPWRPSRCAVRRLV